MCIGLIYRRHREHRREPNILTIEIRLKFRKHLRLLRAFVENGILRANSDIWFVHSEWEIVSGIWFAKRRDEVA